MVPSCCVASALPPWVSKPCMGRPRLLPRGELSEHTADWRNLLSAHTLRALSCVRRCVADSVEEAGPDFAHRGIGVRRQKLATRISAGGVCDRCVQIHGFTFGEGLVHRLVPNGPASSPYGISQ